MEGLFWALEINIEYISVQLIYLNNCQYLAGQDVVLSSHELLTSQKKSEVSSSEETPDKQVKWKKTDRDIEKVKISSIGQVRSN